MTKKEAIEILEIQISNAKFYARYTNNDKDVEKELKDVEAFRMAIEALSADTVSREEYDKLQHDYNELYDITNGLLDRLLGLNH